MLYEGKHYKCITHTKYKYELITDVYSWCKFGEYHFKSTFMELKRDGTFILRRGYASDGCSGPTFDTPNTFHAGFGHDGLYQALRLGLLPQKLRKQIDKWFYNRLRDDGMSWFRASCYYRGVRLFGSKHAKLLIILPVLLCFTSCIQVNIGSSVVNVSSQKVMYNSKGQIVGSELKENLLDQDAKADLKK